MGGFGSGQHGGKRCTDDMHAVDVRRLHRERLLVPGQSFGWQWHRNGEVVASIGLAVRAGFVDFSYRHQRHGQWQDVHCTALLVTTPCRYGGTRAWWQCPCCGRRVALLYVGNLPACRHCYGLAYRCTRETAYDRATRRADTLRERLGWEPGILNGDGTKPKGMHWRTFERLSTRHDSHVATALAGMSARMNLQIAKLADKGLW